MAKPAGISKLFPTCLCDMFDVAVGDPGIDNHSGDGDITPEESAIEDEIAFYVRKLMVLARMHHVTIEDSEYFYAWVKEQVIVISRKKLKKLSGCGPSITLRVVK